MGRPLSRDLTGQRFGELTVIRRYGSKHPVRWYCRCTCGRTATPLSGHLLSGGVTSCGCLRGKHISEKKSKHGESKRPTPEYRAWRDMRARCTSPSHPAYARYGGRGIGVDPRWITFEQFLKDMGRRPSPKHSLERKDNDGHYSPENCVWATSLEQQNNTRANRNLTFMGKTQSVRRWAVELGITPGTLSSRLRRGWPVERALSKLCRFRV